MSETVAMIGAWILGFALVPQLFRLLRTRRADDVSAGFAFLNIAGLALLAVRAVELGETALATINTLAAGFWGLVLAVKLAQRVPQHPDAYDVRPQKPTVLSGESSNTPYVAAPA